MNDSLNCNRHCICLAHHLHLSQSETVVDGKNCIVKVEMNTSLVVVMTMSTIVMVMTRDPV